MEFPAKTEQTTGSFHQTDGNAQLAVFSSFLKDIVVRDARIIQQFLQDVLLFDQNRHFVPVGLQLGDCILIVMEMGRMPKVNQDSHAELSMLEIDDSLVQDLTLAETVRFLKDLPRLSLNQLVDKPDEHLAKAVGSRLPEQGRRMVHHKIGRAHV